MPIPPLQPHPQRLRALLAQLDDGLLEREAAVRLLLWSALAGVHVLLIGPPGTAKSELARRLQSVLADAAWFERLLTRFSTPEELFGPLSLKALEQDRYERLTAGFLPTAGVAFLDEVYKANSAILNALLGLLHERVFDNGSGRQPVPLICVVGATNELPADEALLAFHDRFLVRVPVSAVGDDNFAALLKLSPAQAPGAQPLTADERQAVARAASAVRLSDDLLAACAALRARLAADGQPLSDRRWRQWMDFLRTAAATEGRTCADALDLWTAPYVAAATPAQVPALQAWVDAEIAQAVPQQAPWLTRAVQAFEMQLQIEQMAPPDEARSGSGTAESAGKLAVAQAVGRVQAAPDWPADGDASAADHAANSVAGPATTGTAAMPRIRSAGLEAHQQRRWSPVHVQARLTQIDGLRGQVQARFQAVQTQANDLAQRLAQRLWLPVGLGARWQAAHATTLSVLQALLDRLETTRAGFAALPQDQTLPPLAPAPVVWEAAAPAAGEPAASAFGSAHPRP
jgi:MoxR-like ATPase